jgi:hypothetical protein
MALRTLPAFGQERGENRWPAAVSVAAIALVIARAVNILG